MSITQHDILDMISELHLIGNNLRGAGTKDSGDLAMVKAGALYDTGVRLQHFSKKLKGLINDGPVYVPVIIEETDDAHE